MAQINIAILRELDTEHMRCALLYNDPTYNDLLNCLIVLTERIGKYEKQYGWDFKLPELKDVEHD